MRAVDVDVSVSTEMIRKLIFIECALCVKCLALFAKSEVLNVFSDGSNYPMHACAGLCDKT